MYLHNMRDLIPNPPLTSSLYTYNPQKSSVAAYQYFSFINLKMANEKGRNK